MDNNHCDILLDNPKQPCADLGPQAQTTQSEAAGETAGSGATLTGEELIAAQADNLQNVVGAAHLYMAVTHSVAPQIGTEAFPLYREKLLKDAGTPSDPMEIMLIEQIALANFHIGRLHLKSCVTKDDHLSIAYADAAMRLMAEFRRSALALEDFRAKQLARKGPAVTAPEAKPAEKTSAKPKKPAKTKKTPAKRKEQTNGHSENPEWLKRRMQYPAPNGSRQDALTN